tara:strand:- start:1292 stop:1621 length:330 start_codon:yes stop_codon:yes gene_type:complete
MKGVAWKNLRFESDELVYILQVDNITGKRDENKLLKEVSSWNQTGDMYDPANKVKSILFRRSFSTEAEWVKWARSFPLPLEEITEKTGRCKPYKLGLEYQIKKAKKKNV